MRVGIDDGVKEGDSEWLWSVRVGIESGVREGDRGVV